MKTNEIRASFLNFFAKKGHRAIPSDSLVPSGDPTLLFTGAGMNQFKDYFLGVKKDLRRAASCQKCLRTGDLDNVGKTPYHHSFFEMLGNFSFGDYFKPEAIEYAFEFLTGEMRIPKERLRVSVHLDDSAAYEIWKKRIGFSESRIKRLGDDSNFWPARAREMGPNGPCGPCSEVYFDQGDGFRPCPRKAEGKACDVDCDCGRFAEIWNLVFTQFDRLEEGRLVPLAAPNIDTGMGLERLACVLQGQRSNFEIDILSPLVDFLEKESKPSKEIPRESRLNALRMIVDHVRAACFAIGDGVVPSNEGRGYVVRKLIRRAVWKATQEGGLKNQRGRSLPELFKLVERIAKVMEVPYPYLNEERKRIEMTLRGEEERFLGTLEEGQVILKNVIHETKEKGSRKIGGESVFKLYDTYGFPDEITASLAVKEGLEIDREGFETLMEQQRERARGASKISGSIFVVDQIVSELLRCHPTQFVGYEALKAEGFVEFFQKEGEEAWAVLNQTPFYAEQGGQVGDQGIWNWEGGEASVVDTQWKENRIVHRLKINAGVLKAGLKVIARVDEGLREKTRRHHTATHLLQSALRELLGTHVRQQGSLVSPEKLRFDFSHPQSLSPEQIREVENFINGTILKNLSVLWEEKSFEESQKEGALAFFGEKYSDRVRVVIVEGGLSKELCGGTHVNRTGDIGLFLISKESAVASGVRRIEAVAGLKALEWVRGSRQELNQIAQLLKVSSFDVSEKVAKIMERMKSLEKKPLFPTFSKEESASLIRQAKVIKGTQLILQVLDGLSAAGLREASDLLRQQAKKTVIILFSKEEERVNVIVSLTPDFKDQGPDADVIVKKIAELIGGSGGGRRDLAQGGSKNPELVERAMAAIPSFIKELI